PEKKAKQLAARAKLEQGDKLAEEGDVDGAIASLKSPRMEF
ncbi:hypothetical protein LYNGBM3L_33960, partial [Moorena producens 3L]